MPAPENKKSAHQQTPTMDWTHGLIWFLCVSVCECWWLPRSEPPMHGEITSPWYPQPYPPNLSTQWDLEVPEGYQIRLTFTHLDIEASAHCYYDALTILDSNNKVLGKLCGQENSVDGHHPGNQAFLSPGNRLTLTFQTDDSNPELRGHIGFSAHYQAIDTDECSGPEDSSGPLCSHICHNTLGSYLCSCHHGYELHPDQRTCVLSCGGGIFDEPEGSMSSPGYPDPSPNGMSCQYVISVETGFLVSLNFTDNFHIESVDMEGGPSCLYHWLQVTVPEREPVKLCGGRTPGLMVTNSSTVRLDYHTDWAGLSRGWSLEYSTQRVRCPSPSGVANGRVTPMFTEYFYRDLVQVRCDPGYKLKMDGRDITSYVSVCQSDGQWHLPLPECRIVNCGEPKPLLNGGVIFLSGSDNQYRSVIQYHCNKPFYSLLVGANVNYTCAADERWRDDLDTPIIPPCIPVCGQPTVPLSETHQRIIGGKAAPANSIPWQVLLSIPHLDSRAGGMVIGDHWVMTAAHVLIHDGIQLEKDDIVVRMGDNDVLRLTNLTLYKPHAVGSLHVHPQYYNTDDMDFDNDIALIKLQEPLTFHASIMPVCLPARGAIYDTDHMGMVSGFGVTVFRIRKVTNELKYISIPVVDQQICALSFDEIRRTNNNMVPPLSDNMFCAGLPDTGKDTCQGDSGGAFVLLEDDRYWAAGIVSWGSKCGLPGRYGAYTRVANYLDWIEKTMNEN